jgi:hypothetical protein
MRDLNPARYFFMSALLCGPMCGLFAAEDSDDLTDIDAIAIDADSQQCVSLQRISRTEVINSSNILFYMRNRTIFLNTLPHKCPGLRRRDGFAYKTSINQLCNVDTITVIRGGNPSSPAGLGSTCGLGMFRPVSAEQVQLLKNKDSIPVDSEQGIAEIESEDESDTAE